MNMIRPAQRPVGRRWAACGASVTGSMHQQRGLGCDDAYGYGVAGDFVVAAVADGAGSVSGTSAWGAHVACASVMEHSLQSSFIDGYRSASVGDADQMVRWLFGTALERVYRQSDAMGLNVALLSTTLSVALVSDDRAVFGQIGDGVIAVESSGGIETLLVEQKDGYANTTSFIQSERALETSLRTAARNGVSAMALSTDGMSYKITNVATGEPYEPFFRGCWQHLREGAAVNDFGAMLGGIEDDQTGDDKTMVLAVVCDGSAVGHPDSTPILVDSSPPPRSVGAHVGHRADSAPGPMLHAGSAATPLASEPAAQRRRRWGWRQRR
jgi:hypothetical protein